MAVKIRLKQVGKRNARKFRVVAVDKSKKRDGRVLDELGFIDPTQTPTQTRINRKRVDYWINKGAKLTTSVDKIISQSQST